MPEEKDAKIAELEKENDILRGIAAKIMPCMHCGVDNIAKCPHGFPGCALADDLMCAEETANRECRALREAFKPVVEQLTAAQDRLQKVSGGLAVVSLTPEQVNTIKKLAPKT